MEEEIRFGRMIKNIDTLLRNVIKEDMEKLNLPNGYAYVLKYLYMSNENTVNQKHIMEFNKCKASSISITLQNMERDGLIERIKSKDDSRKIEVSLTHKGYKEALEVENIFNKVERKLANAIDDDEKENFIRNLNKLEKALEMDGGLDD